MKTRACSSYKASSYEKWLSFGYHTCLLEDQILGAAGRKEVGEVGCAVRADVGRGTASASLPVRVSSPEATGLSPDSAHPEPGNCSLGQTLVIGTVPALLKAKETAQSTRVYLVPSSPQPCLWLGKQAGW